MENLLEKEKPSFQQGSDDMLIERAFFGDHTAFECLVSRYHSALLNFVRRWSVTAEQGEDIVQFVFLQCYLSLPRLYQPPPSTPCTLPLGAWLFRVAANRCIDETRRKHLFCFSDLRPLGGDAGELQEEASPEVALIDPSPLPEEVAEQRELQGALCAAIAALPGKWRAIVWLRYTEELTYKEIGQRLHMRENTVKIYFHRARHLLQTSLTDIAERGKEASMLTTSLEVKNGRRADLLTYPNPKGVSHVSL